MATPIPKNDVPMEKVKTNDECGLSPNRTFVIPYFTKSFRGLSTTHGFIFDDEIERHIPGWATKAAAFDIQMFLDLEDLRRIVIAGRNIRRYLNAGYILPYLNGVYMNPFERIRFTMKCSYCHQTSPISYASLRDKLNSIDMYQKLNARSINHFPYHRYPFVTCPKCKRVILFPRWMPLIDRVKYVPTLLEGALEIGRMSMQDEYKDWVDGPYYLDIDSMCSIAAHEAEPGYWFISDRNQYPRELKI